MDLTQSFGGQWEDLLVTNVSYEIEEIGHHINTPVFHIRSRDKNGKLVETEVEGFRPYFGVKANDFRNQAMEICNDRRVIGVEVDCSPELWKDVIGFDDDQDPDKWDIEAYLSNQMGADIYHTETPFDTIYEETLARIYVRVPSDVGGDSGMRGDLDCDTYEADIPFVRRFLITAEIYQAISVDTEQERVTYENWPGESDGRKPVQGLEPCDPPAINPRMIVYDIEVATEGDGFPQPERANKPINSISAYDSYDDEYKLWGLVSDEWDDVDPEQLVDDVEHEVNDRFDLDFDDFKLFSSETNLLESFHSWVLDCDPDIFTGYNADGFDTPYLIQRSYNMQALSIKRYGVTGTPGVWVEEYDGNRQVNFSMPDRITLDILDAYKKTQFRALDSYRLDAVAEAELGFGKVDLAGDELDDAWHHHPIEFFTYSVRDSQATAEIEKEAGLLSLFENLRQVTGAPYETAVSNGPMLDTLFLRRAHEKGHMLPSNTKPDENVYHGAKVFDPVPGVHKNCVYPDLSSMYPSLFAMLNLGSETIVGSKTDLDSSEYTEDDCFQFPVDEREFAVVKKGEPIDHIDRDKYKGVKTPKGGIREMFDPQYDWFYVVKPDIKESFVRDTVDELIDLKNMYSGDMYSAIKRVTNCFTPDTDVVTKNGQEKITDLNVGDEVYSINPETNEVELKPIVDVHEYPNYDGELVDIKTVRSDFSVTPNHRMLVKAYNDNLKFVEARNLKSGEKYKYANNWSYESGNGIDEVDITKFLDPDKYDICSEYDCHGHKFRSQLPDGCEKKRANYHYGFIFSGETFEEYQEGIESLSSDTKITTPDGNGSTFRPYKFGGDEFIELIGWHITEGYVYHPEGVNTASVKIAQENEEGREQLEDLFDRMGLDPSVDRQGYTIGSKIYGDLLDNLCKSGSENKHIPEFIFEEASTDQKQMLFETMMLADGCAGIYYTNSTQLKDDFIRLCVEIGIKPRVTRRGKTWEIFGKQVPDGFVTDNNTSTSQAESGVYCVTVKDNHTLLAGRNGKFQFVGQSVYGVAGDSASGGKGFRLYDRRVAEGITLAGRLTITHTAEKFTNYLNDNYDPDSILVGGDTDSSVTSMPNAPDMETAWDWAMEAVEHVDDSYDQFVVNTFGFDPDDDHRLAVELESLASGLFYMSGDEVSNYRTADDGFLVKNTEEHGVRKRYAQHLVWDDDDGWLDTEDPDDGYEEALEDPEDRSDLKKETTVTYDTYESGPLQGMDPHDNVSITGFEYVRSDSAQITRDAQMQILSDILLSDDAHDRIESYLLQLVDDIKSGEVPLEDLARPKGISQQLDEYGWKALEDLDDEDITDEVEAQGGKYRQKAGPTYRGAKYVDDWFQWEDLGEGSKPLKIPIEKVRGDEYPAAYEYHSYPKDSSWPDPLEIGDTVDAIAVENTERIPEQFVIDRETIIEKELEDKLEGILETMDLDWDDLMGKGTQSGLDQFM